MTKPTIVRKLRCAVYTRKSSEEGLEQEFNSLHAQREACEAYVASQRSEGWALIREPYDDGGFSGGTLPPIHMPFWRDALILSRTLSAMTSRSNWAKESRMLSVSRPIEVVVLNDWVTLTNVTPDRSKISTSFEKSISERDSRSIL